jgi:outer membrane biosynthesis protein TonB
MRIQIPPFPESGGGGVLVDIGFVDEASGKIQPVSSNVITEAVPEKVNTRNDPESFATQDLEEAPIIKKENVVKKKEPVKTATKPKETTKPAEPVRRADPKASYPGSTNASSSQGTGSGKGDQGKQTGNPNALYSGPGDGSGGQGSGTGPGTGAGPGGLGKGVSFSLSGRRMIQPPKISDQSQETGTVVVDITVGKDGSVTSAIPGGRGTTTTSSLLFRLARESASKTKFNASPDGAEIQKGTITFVFVVN